MTDYIRLSEAPQWCIQYPTCSACATDLDTDGDGWICPSCGTLWSMDATDGDTGELYEAWAGEPPGGPNVAEGDAWRWGGYRERLARHRQLPTLIPHPGPPPRP